MVIDHLVDHLSLGLIPAKGDWYCCTGTYLDNDFYLMKPTTFMNNSGIAVSDYLSYNNIPLKDILIVFDDFQIPLGTIRVRTQGSDGGHNGVSNIIYHLNTLDFPRMRIGIGGDEAVDKKEYVDYVLSNFEQDEIEKIKTLMPYYRDCVLSFITEDIKTTMNKFNRNFLETDETENESELKNNNNS